MVTFTQYVRDVTALDADEMEYIIAQGIKSGKDLSLFGDKEIDQLFQTPGLKTVPLMSQLKLKALAAWLRNQSDAGHGFPIHVVTQEDVDDILMERARG
jgi:hypothetical protein